MKTCSSINRRTILRSWDHHRLRTYPRTVSRKPLSNTELLEFISKGKEDSNSTAVDPTNPDGLNSQEDDIHTQTAPLHATRIPRLPQSPLTDQSLVAARTRHTAVKPFPSADRSPFQSKLQKNPFAVALATPPRLCISTGLRLPSYFQIPFGVATHPNTGAPWHLPKLPTRAVSDTGDDGMSRITPAATPPSPLEPDDASKTPKSSVRMLSSTHFLASRQVLAHVSALAPSKYERLIPYRWRQDPSVKIADIVWREDMDTFVLGILRRNISKTLSYLASRSAAYIAPCKSSGCINNHDQVAAVLWLSKDADTSIHKEPATGDSVSFDGRETGPPPYAMHYYKTHYIPCYNLAALLGLVQLSALQEGRPDHYSDQFAVIKLKRNTVKVQLELWKLLGYIVNDGKYG